MKFFGRVIALACLFLSCANAQMKFSLIDQDASHRTGEPIYLIWKLQNDSNRSWVVYSHTVGPQENFDQISIAVSGPSGSRNIDLITARTASASFGCRLAPGAALHYKFDLVRWARQYDYAISPGTYRIIATFRHPAEQWAPLFVGQAVRACGATTRGGKIAVGSEIYNGTLTAPQISVLVR